MFMAAYSEYRCLDKDKGFVRNAGIISSPADQDDNHKHPNRVLDAVSRCDGRQ